MRTPRASLRRYVCPSPLARVMTHSSPPAARCLAASRAWAPRPQHTARCSAPHRTAITRPPPLSHTAGTRHQTPAHSQLLQSVHSLPRCPSLPLSPGNRARISPPADPHRQLYANLHATRALPSAAVSILLYHDSYQPSLHLPHPSSAAAGMMLTGCWVLSQQTLTPHNIIPIVGIPHTLPRPHAHHLQAGRVFRCLADMQRRSTALSLAAWGSGVRHHLPAVALL